MPSVNDIDDYERGAVFITYKIRQAGKVALSFKT